MAVGASYETSPGRFSEVYFYDDGICHDRDGQVEEDTYSFDYMPADQLKDFAKPGRRTKLKFRPRFSKLTAVPDKSRKRKRDEEVSQFFSDEAAEVGADEEASLLFFQNDICH